MTYYVYMLKSINNNKPNKSYVGYTSNLSERINKHNNNKGAKSTRGYKWVLIYKRYFKDKSKAMSYEYKLKKNRKKRAILLDK